MCLVLGGFIFSVKTAARKRIVSSFEVNNSRLEASDITVPLSGENNEPYSFKIDLSSDGYAGKERAMNAVINAQVWHRRLDRLNKRSLELMNKTLNIGVGLYFLCADCNVYAVGKSYQLPHPKPAN